MSCQPPGEDARVDAAELARQPDRAGGHARARGRSARDLQPRVAADEVGEPGGEPGEAHQPRPSRCARRRPRRETGR